MFDSETVFLLLLLDMTQPMKPSPAAEVRLILLRLDHTER